MATPTPPQNDAAKKPEPPRYPIDKDKEPLVYAVSQSYLWEPDEVSFIEQINPNKKYPLLHPMPDGSTKVVEVLGSNIRTAYATDAAWENRDDLVTKAPGLGQGAKDTLAHPAVIAKAISSEQDEIIKTITDTVKDPGLQATLIQKVKNKMMDDKAVKTLTTLNPVMAQAAENYVKIAGQSAAIVKMMNLELYKSEVAPAKGTDKYDAGQDKELEAMSITSGYSKYLDGEDKKKEAASPAKAGAMVTPPTEGAATSGYSSDLQGLLEGFNLKSLASPTQENLGKFSLNNFTISTALKNVKQNVPAANNEFAVPAEPEGHKTLSSLVSKPKDQQDKKSSGVAA